MVNMKTIKRLTISKNPIQDVVGIHVDSMHVDTSWYFSQCRSYASSFFSYMSRSSIAAPAYSCLVFLPLLLLILFRLFSCRLRPPLRRPRAHRASATSGAASSISSPRRRPLRRRRLRWRRGRGIRRRQPRRRVRPWLRRRRRRRPRQSAISVTTRRALPMV